jgi:uroporphyrinogen-III decarboxylase
MVENTSTTLLSPDQYRRYCVPYLKTYADIFRNAGRPLILHMCGHLKDLLPDLARIPAVGFEAFTTPPVGNTTLAEGRAECPAHALIGGTNAVLWTRPVEEIEAALRRDLDALPHHRGLVITSAGVMPPLCRPETIRCIAQWIYRYPARF